MRLVAAPHDGDILDASESMYPSRLEVVASGTRSFERATSTVYGFVVSGTARVRCQGISAKLDAGAFFAVPGLAMLDAAGSVVTFERFGFRGMVLLGQIEAEGRLSYIDGCSDSVLTAPPRAGDPVVNHLHFPPGVVQSLHAHPSLRLGVVARGGGAAYGTAGGGWEHPLAAGSVFLLAAHEAHAFKTAAGQSMDVVAYHPDSDWGPSDAVHPMLNRTYLAKG